MSNLKAVVYGRLEQIADAEKITRVQLGMLSRELLLYVPDTQDIAIVNRLVHILTPMNARTAILFFTHFLPWEIEKDDNDNFIRFGKKSKKLKVLTRKDKMIKDFLAAEENDIWTWAKANVKIEQKTVSMNDILVKAVKEALLGKDTKTQHADPLTPAEVAAVFLAELDEDTILEAITAAETEAANADVPEVKPAAAA